MDTVFRAMLKSGRGVALVVILAVCLAAPGVLAADVADIGYVDQSVLSSLPAFVAANKQFNEYGQRLRAQYLGRAQHASRATQAQLAQEFSSQIAAEQRRVVGPLLSKAQIAIASVASSKSLTVIVDKRIVVFGGTDITSNVRDLLTSPGDPVPPVSTPGPSSVGFVDQRAIDALPKVKSAQEKFAEFRSQADGAAQVKLKAAKTDGDRQAIYADYKKTLDAKSDELLKPIVDETRGVVSDVAKKKGLALVIDRDNIIYGGQDITSDVTAALK